MSKNRPGIEAAQQQVLVEHYERTGSDDFDVDSVRTRLRGLAGMTPLTKEKALEIIGRLEMTDEQRAAVISTVEGHFG